MGGAPAGLGVPAAEIFFSNPVKSRESIAYAAGKGVEWFVVDSTDELRRVFNLGIGYCAVVPEADAGDGVVIGRVVAA